MNTHTIATSEIQVLKKKFNAVIEEDISNNHNARTNF